MKKIIKIIFNILSIILCVFYYFINTCYAINEETIYLTSNKEIYEKGDEIEIAINIENQKTSAFNFSLYFDKLKLEYISDLENTNIIENRIIFVWHDKNGGKGAKEGELIKVKFKAKEEGIATFNIQGEFYNETGKIIKSNFKQKQIQIGLDENKLEIQPQEEKGINTNINNATLQVLRLDKEGLTPNFQKDIYDYYLTIKNDVNNLEILAIGENPNSNIEITGNTNLKEGSNLIKIQVTSQDGTQKNVYTINVTKTANIELANTNLEILAIQNVLLNPPFDPNSIQYSSEISNDTTKLNIFAVPENEHAKVEIIGNSELQVGNNLIDVVVTAQNGFSKKVYQVNIYKRNLQEETKHQEEQNVQKDMLNKAYEIEELSSINNEEKHVDSKVDNKQSVIILGIVIALIVIIIGIFVFFRYFVHR